MPKQCTYGLKHKKSLKGPMNPSRVFRFSGIAFQNSKHCIQFLCKVNTKRRGILKWNSAKSENSSIIPEGLIEFMKHKNNTHENHKSTVKALQYNSFDPSVIKE